MPPRHRTSSAAAAPLGLCDLPDELLLRVLERLPITERFRCVAPVSRRLHSLCLAPQLLRSVEFAAPSYSAQLIERLQSLLLFLQRTAAHVRSLSINAEAAEQADCAYALAACLGVASTMPRLDQLTLVPVFDCGRLLGGATGLRGLYLERAAGASDLYLGQLSRLTALRELHLSGRLLCPGPATKPCLPPSLETLCIEGDLGHEDRNLPRQLLLGLTNLQRLTLVDFDYSSASLAPISALSALSRLDLVACDFFPPPTSLSTLSNLRQLRVASAVESMDAVEGMLAALPGLTALALRLGDLYSGTVPRLPDGVTALRHLRRFSYSTCRSGLLDDSIPGGTWLAQLHWLGLPWWIAVPAAASLATATQLQHLCLFALPPYELGSSETEVTDEAWAAFWRTLQAHAPLQTLHYEVQSGRVLQLCRPFVDGLLELSSRRPALRIARTEHEGATDHPGFSPFCEAMLNAAAELAA